MTDKARARAETHGLPPDLVEALRRQMIGWFIQYEEEKLRQDWTGNPRGHTLNLKIVKWAGL